MQGLDCLTRHMCLRTDKAQRMTSKLGVHLQWYPNDRMWALPLPGTPLWEYGEQLGVIGKKDHDVAGYLTRVSDAGCFRRYYINLNGAPMSEICFWEHLVLLEASRTFHKLNNVNKKLTKKYKETYLALMKANPRNSLRYTALTFTILSFIVAFLMIVIRKTVTDKLLFTNKIVTNSHNIILAADPDGKVIYANDSVKRILGYKPEEVMGDESDTNNGVS